ncbi:MAG: transglutaminase domain-containing protein [Myxococcota bacterium]
MKDRELELSVWDRIVAGAAHPVRGLAWIVAIGSAAGPIGGVSWVLVGMLAVVVGLAAGEVAGRGRVRTPWLVGGTLGLVALAWVVRGFLTTYALVPSVLGPTFTLWISLLLGLGSVVVALTGVLRVLGLRGPAFQAVELFLVGGLLANAVASHRDGSIARPLWLSDLSWSFGVDPGRVLLVFGAVMTGLLAGLLLLGAQRRKPGVGLLALPVFALIAWFLATQFPVLDPPDPEELFAEAGGDEGQSAGVDGPEAPKPKPEDGSDAGKPKPEDGTDAGKPKPEDGTDAGKPKPEDGSQDGSDAGEPKPEDGSQDGSDAGKPKPEDGSQDGSDGSDGGEPKPEDGSQDGADGGQPKPDPNGQGSAEPSDENDTPSDKPPEKPPDPLEGGGGGGGNAPVAVVLVDDDYAPPSGYWYLRQGVLADYNGTRLVESSVPGASDDILDHFAVAEEDLPFQPPLTHRMVVHGSVSLLVEHPNPFGPEAPVQYTPRANPNPARFDRSYAFVSHMLTAQYADYVGLGVGDPAWSEELRAQYLETADDPRYAELAAEVRDAFVQGVPEEIRDDPFVQAVAVTTWIGENMKYSKAERHADVPDPTADFLFGNRIGYCVHTAHASVYLWRELGIPARVATGYAVEEANRRGSSLVVKAGDAHAWSELYITGVGWVPLDVTPAETLDPPADPPDEDESEMLGEMARHQPDQPQGPRPDYSWIWKVLGYGTGGVLGTLVLGTLVLHWAAKAWRRIRPLWAGPRALSRVGYRTALDLLAEAGLVRESGETREAFARRLGMPALQQLTALHLRGALGGGDAATQSGRSRAEWTGLLARLRVEIAEARPLWRRILGLIDPSSVYRTR